MKHKIKLLYLALTMLLSLFLTACWDNVELENRGFVTAMGIDKYKPEDMAEESTPNNEKDDKKVIKDENKPENEENRDGNNNDNGAEENKDEKKEGTTVDFEEKNEPRKRFAITMAFPNLGAIAGSNAEGETKSIKKAESETIAGAVRIADSVSSQRIYLGHSKICVFGNELLDDAELVKEALDYLERNRDVSRKTIMLASKGSAEEILNIEPVGEALIGKFITDFYTNNPNSAAITIRLDLEHLINQLRETSCAILPEIKINGNEVKISGAAVIKDYKAAGRLNDKQMRGYLWFKGNAVGSEINAEVEKTNIPIRISENKTGISFYEENGKTKCLVNVYAEGSVEEYGLDSETMFTNDNLRGLEAAYEEVIAKELLETESLFKNDFKTDGFGYKGLIRKFNYGLYLKHEADWEQAFSEIELVPQVNVIIRNMGSIR